MKPNHFKKGLMMTLRTCSWGIVCCLLTVAALVIATPSSAAAPDDGSVLPFPPTPSASVAAPTLQESKHQRRVWSQTPAEGRAQHPHHPARRRRLRPAGHLRRPGPHADALAPRERGHQLQRLPHHRDLLADARGAADRAQPPARRLRHHRRAGGGLGRLHRGDSADLRHPRRGAWRTTATRPLPSASGTTRPPTETTAMGPFTLWPTGEGIGFDYFYGFLAGETSQWEPRLVREPQSRRAAARREVPPERGPGGQGDHLDASKHRAFSPDKPFFMYWAPGAGHGPHHIFKEWADKYKGKFDDGWDAMRERIFKRQKELGWIPADAKLTPRAEIMAAWDSIPESERPFQRRLMEVFAGFVEHVDAQAGKRRSTNSTRLGIRDNTIVIYIWGDNGSSAEGQNGTISELLAQNQIPNTVEQQLDALDKLGGLDALGGPKVDNMYHAGWAWAGDTPFQYTKLIASHFGGTRNPMVDLLAEAHQARQDAALAVPPRQRHRADDLRDPRHQAAQGGGRLRAGPDRRHAAWSTPSPMPRRPAHKHTQYFDNNGSRGIYHDGWYACTFGPLTPWLTVSPGLATWDSSKDVWELYDLSNGLLAGGRPRREGAGAPGEDEGAVPRRGKGEQGLPDRRGHLAAHPSRRPHQDALHELALRLDHHPHARVHRAGPRPREQPRRRSTPSSARTPSACSTRSAAPPAASPLYMDKGELVYEYNMMIIERYIARSKSKLPAGKHRIEVDTTIAEARRAGRGRAQRGRQGGRAHDREAHRARRVHRQRDLRRRRGPRLARVARLLRPAAVRLYRQDREGGGRAEIAGDRDV